MLIEGLVHDHVVNVLINLLSDRSKAVDSVHFDVLQELVNALVLDLHLLDQGLQEVNQRRVIVEDAEIQAEEERGVVVLDIV